MNRIVAFLYGVVSYLVFLGTFLYAVGFVGGFLVPKSVDSGVAGPVAQALLVNALLLLVFGLQHSVMARPGFKKWWTQFIPPPVERSTYVLLASLALALLFWQWRPIFNVVWYVQNPIARFIIWTLFALGWVIVLISTFLISHFDLFGLRQVWLYHRGREYQHDGFVTPFLYKFVRHPIMLGFIIAFWATPMMSASHLVFSIATTAYIIVGILLEERDMASVHGAAYAEYRKEVAMLVPTL
jgi:protein-S-isoprenylcysteine O-methyltransferase Ste14